MTYEEALKKFPELGHYSVSELELVITGMRLIREYPESAAEAITAVVDHIEDTLKGA